MYELVGPKSYLVYQKEIEYMCAAVELLDGYGKNKEIFKVFPKEKIQAQKGKYRWLSEVYSSLSKEYHFGMFEFLATYDLENFSLEAYEEYLIALPVEEFMATFFQWISKEEILLAKKSEKNTLEFYEKHSDLFEQFLAFQYFFQDTHNFIHMFFEFVKSLKSEEAEAYLDARVQEIEVEKEMFRTQLQTKAPFAYTEELMGKNCYNRGPYEIFYFMPSLFFSMLACRFFGQNQFLIYNPSLLKESRLNVPEQLKVMSDPTRYRILLLLKETPHLTGVEIAKKMGLATSTVSHHMNALRDCGLVFEEPVGSTKCYSIALRKIENSIKLLQDAFLQ